MKGHDPTMHVDEEDLILHYYREAADAHRIAAHLSICAACRDDFSRLQQVLSIVEQDDVPEPPPSFEHNVWARLEPQLPARESAGQQGAGRLGWLAGWFTATRWVYAGGIAALILAAFVAGRMSSGPMQAPPATTAADVDLTEGVLLVAVVDHLDRSQMVLVELMNADVDATPASVEAEQSRARELVFANRLYRQTAAQAGDEATTDVLDELERVLLEIANTPQNATKEELDAVRARIESRGLLFRVRVVHSEMLERERKASNAGSTS